MAFSPRALVVLALCLVAALAIPTEDTSPIRTPVQSDPFPACRPRSSTWPFAKLRDLIIEKIWGQPPREKKPALRSHFQATSAPANFRTRYGGDVVLRFKINTEDDVKALSQASEILYLDIWESTDQWVDIRIAKDVVPSFLGLLPHSLRKSHTPLMHDLAQAVYDTFPGTDDSAHSTPPTFTSALHRPSSQADEGRELFFQEYQPLSVIYPWMRLMTSLFPSHVRMETIGFSHEGRDIAALRVGVHPTNNKEPSSPRNTILISGGSHAREWIATTTVNYVAYSLITRYGKFPAVTKLLEQFDLVFIPTMNPDGYVYTWDTDRLWRKNRQSTPLPFCHGIDLDRAFGFEWDGTSTQDNPCSESYAGDSPWAATEARALAAWARNETEHNNAKFIAFIDLHSYSQQVLFPYSYSCREIPPSVEDLEEVAMALAKGFRLSNGHYYGVSSACEASILSSRKDGDEMRAKMLLGGGSALDWFYHEMKAKYAYQVKLRDTGSYGFLLPKGNIVPTGQEAFNAVMSLGRYLMGNKGIESLDWEKEMILGKERVAEPKIETKAVTTEPEPEPEPEPEVKVTKVDAWDEDEEQYISELRRRRRR